MKITLIFTCFILHACTLVLFEPEDNLKIEVLDVGQGDAILLSYKDWQVMIDVGPPHQGVWDSLQAKGIQQLDWILITHHHMDHYGALLELFPPLNQVVVLGNGDTLQPQTMNSSILVDKIYHSNDQYQPLPWRQLLSGLESNEIKINLVHAGSQIDFPQSVRGRIFWPQKESQESANAASIVLELIFKGSKLLFMGDLEEEGEQSLLESGVLSSVQFLKVAHHGSKSSSSIPFLIKTEPLLKSISRGCDNVYNHPHSSTMAHLKHFSTYESLEIQDTCLDGTLQYQVNENGVFYID